MSAELFAIGDFSGIQTYVLDVKTAGNEQARRLRARSFLLELFERAALFKLEQRFGVAADDVLVRGGGGFTVRLPAEADTAELERLAADLRHRLWQETGGEVQFALGWGYGTMKRPGPAWNIKSGSRPVRCCKRMANGPLPTAKARRCRHPTVAMFAGIPVARR